MLFFEIGNFNFGSVRNGRDSPLNIGAHAKIIEHVDTVESLLDDNVMAGLREIHDGRGIKLPTCDEIKKKAFIFRTQKGRK